MARAQGSGLWKSNIEPGIKAPLDARMYVECLDELINTDSWMSNGVYVGMMVIVGYDSADTSKRKPLGNAYILTDTETLLSKQASDEDKLKCWKAVGGDSLIWQSFPPTASTETTA